MHRFIFLIIALLAAVACTAATTSPAPASETAPPAAVVPTEVVLADFQIELSTVELRGNEVSFAVVSNGPTPHNFTIRDANGETLLATPDLSADETAELSGTLAPGEYTYFCSLAGHESLGMSGTLTVTER